MSVGCDKKNKNTTNIKWGKNGEGKKGLFASVSQDV